MGNITNADMVLAIAIDGSGGLWGIDATSAVLISINKANAVGAVVGPLGFAVKVGAGLGWDAANEPLYASLYSNSQVRGEIRRVDRVTGVTVPLAIIGADDLGSPRALLWLNFGTPVIGIFSDGFED